MTTTTTTSTTAAEMPEAWALLAAVPRRIIEAWRAHDAAAFAEVFTEDGTMILPGAFATGRTAVREFMERAFAGPYRGTEVSGTPFQVRILGEDTAIMLTEGGVAPAGQDVAEADAVRASWLLVRRDGQWLLAAYQNSPRR